MSGRFKSNGFEYSWDYRQYDKHNPEAFNNPGRFAGHTTPAHRDRLSRSHAGRSNADIRQQAEANEALALNLVDTATSLIRTPAGGISVREWIRSFSQDATKLRGGAADPLLAGAGGGNIRASEGRIPDQAMASKGIEANNKQSVSEQMDRVASRNHPLINDKQLLESLISSSSPGRLTKGRTNQYERSGGFEQANKEFDSLKLSNIKVLPIGRVGEMQDGTRVVVRSVSSDGRPTLEIQSSPREIEIRYNP